MPDLEAPATSTEESAARTSGTLFDLAPIDMDGLMLFILFVGVIAFTLLYIWLLMHRSRAMAMEDILEDRGLDAALVARRAEGGL